MSLSEIKICENTFCEEYFEKVKKISEDLITLTIQKMKNKNVDTKIIKQIKLKLKKITDKLNSKKFKKDTMELCKNSFCNPSCKGTIFQNNKFPQELVNKYSKQKDGKKTIKRLKQMRKNLFEGKKTIIKDGFYKKLPNIKKLKKKGAISGCAAFSLL